MLSCDDQQADREITRFAGAPEINLLPVALEPVLTDRYRPPELCFPYGFYWLQRRRTACQLTRMSVFSSD